MTDLICTLNETPFWRLLFYFIFGFIFFSETLNFISDILGKYIDEKRSNREEGPL